MVEPARTLDAAVPSYDLLEKIGSGGFGEVFRARHAVIGREVAIKIVHARHSSDPAAVARFLIEARAVNQIGHPSIVEIYDVGELPDGRPFCVMELLRGETLRSRLADRGALPLPEALPILRAVATAIDAAHAAGIAHRDVKPDNIFLLPDGSVKLIDFGLAKLTTEDASVTQSGQVFGTPLYMSPEQCRGRAITVATDIYSFGAVAYHALVGEPPFSGEPLDLAVQHINDRPVAPASRNRGLPAHVDDALLAALAKDPAQRPAHCIAVVDALAGTALVRPRRRSWPIVAGASIGVAGIAVLLLARGPAAAEPEVWSQRRLRIDFDGVATIPVLSSDGRTFAYGDEAGWWRHDLATGATERLPLPFEPHQIASVDAFHDGRWLVGLSRESATELVDARTGTHERVMAASWPSQSPDHRLVAGWDAENWLVVHDLATKATRRLTHAPDAIIGTPPRWSPDGSQLLWGRTGAARPPSGVFRTYVTQVADGATAPLWNDVPFRNVTTTDYYAPIAVLPDGRLAWCEGDPVSVRARQPWGGPVTTLARLDETVSDCMIVARGDHIVAILDFSKSTVGVMNIPAAAGQPGIFKQLAGPQRMVPVAADAQRAYAYLPDERAYEAGNWVNAELRTLEVATGTLATLPLCATEYHVVVRGSEALRVTRTRTELRFLSSSDCRVVDQWGFPSTTTQIGEPVCTPGWCSVATVSAGAVHVWRLSPGIAPQDLATIAYPGGIPQVSIAPDATRIALSLVNTQASAVHVITINTGATERVATPPAGYLDGAAWDASGKLLVAGQQIQGMPFALIRLADDGTWQAVWSSKATYLSRITTDPAHERLVGLVSTWQQQVLVLERDQGKRSD